jgi:threonine aldolase
MSAQTQIFFASDNGSPVPPQVIRALEEANQGFAMGYGGDPLTASVVAQLRNLFEAPEAEVFLVGLGTAANALALSSLCQPFQTVFCTPEAHIHMDECNAPEFYTGGAKLTLAGQGDKMSATQLRTALEGEEIRGVHGPQRGPVSITNVTEAGNLYSLSEIREICDVAHDFGLPVHLDGARFANACVALGCSPAEMTWKSGVDVAVFGGTKNGLMGVEAVLFFDPAKARDFALRRKRGAQLYSKHRYLAAQMSAYLAGDLWHDLAMQANAAGAQLRAGLEARGIPLRNRDQANLVFFDLPRAQHRALMDLGVIYHFWGAEDGPADEVVTGRLVCDWSADRTRVDAFFAALDRVLG